MAARVAVISFDHVPPGVTSNNINGNVITYAGYPFFLSVAFSGSVAGVTSDSGGIWLNTSNYGAGGNTYNADAWTLPIAAVSDWGATTRTYIGFRHKLVASPSTATNLGNIFGLSTSANAGIQNVTLVALNDFAWVIGKEYFIEVLVDRQALTRTVRVDGTVVVNAQAIANTVLSCVGFTFGQQAAGGQTAPHYFKDMYFQDDILDGTSPGFWGPGKLIPLAETGGVAGNWTGTVAGTVDAILNTGGVAGFVAATAGAETSTTPAMKSPTDSSALKLAFTGAGLDPSLPIRAVQLHVSSARAPASSSQLNSTLTDQATPTPHQLALPPKVYASDAYVANAVLTTLTKALDGNDWTVTKINQLGLTATPASVGG